MRGHNKVVSKAIGSHVDAGRERAIFTNGNVLRVVRFARFRGSIQVRDP